MRARPLALSLVVTFIVIAIPVCAFGEDATVENLPRNLLISLLLAALIAPGVWAYFKKRFFLLSLVITFVAIGFPVCTMGENASKANLPINLLVSLLITALVAPVIWGYFKKLQLHWHILIAMGCGALIWVAGFFLHASTEFMHPLGEIFIRLLKMVIVPLVMSSIIVGVAGVSDPKNLGRLGLKTFGYYTLTSFLAIMIGLFLANTIKPGVGVDIPTSEVYSAESLEQPGSVFEIVIRMIPTNPVSAASEGDMLGIIFFSLFFGFAMARVSANYRDKVLPFVDSFFHIMMKVTEEIIRLAPVGVVGLIVAAFNRTVDPSKENPFELFQAVGLYFGTIGIGLSIHLFVVLPALFYLFTRRSPVRQFSHMASALTTAFSTSSSSATLPVTMECVEVNAKVSNKISSFVLPMGATINMDGTALYECAGVLFIAQVLGIDLNLTQQMIVVITALLASIGAAGVPSAGLVMIFIVLDAVGIEGEMVGVIVGTMLAIDRPLDMYRTAVNIFSDSVGTVIIAHSEGEIAE